MVSAAVVGDSKPSGPGSFITSPAAVIAVAEKHAPNAQGETLAPLIRQVLDEAGVTTGDVDAIGVGLGPGPFTGLRVGVVTAAGLADALGVPAYGMCSLDAIAHLHTQVEDFAVVTDARRKQVYWARYGDTGARLDGPELARPDDLAAALSGRVRVVVGAGALLYPEAFGGFQLRVALPWPSAAWLAGRALSKHMLGAVPEPLEPLYLRRPDAKPPAARKRVTPA